MTGLQFFSQLVLALDSLISPPAMRLDALSRNCILEFPYMGHFALNAVLRLRAGYALGAHRAARRTLSADYFHGSSGFN